MSGFFYLLFWPEIHSWPSEAFLHENVLAYSQIWAAQQIISKRKVIGISLHTERRHLRSYLISPSVTFKIQTQSDIFLSSASKRQHLVPCSPGSATCNHYWNILMKTFRSAIFVAGQKLFNEKILNRILAGIVAGSKIKRVRVFSKVLRSVPRLCNRKKSI